MVQYEVMNEWKCRERNMDMENVLGILKLSCIIGVSQAHLSTVLHSAVSVSTMQCTAAS